LICRKLPTDLPHLRLLCHGWAQWLHWWSPTSFIDSQRRTNFTRAPTGTLLRHAVCRSALVPVRQAASPPTNSSVGGANTIDRRRRANPLIDIWTRPSVQMEYWRARNLRAPRPFQRCLIRIHTNSAQNAAGPSRATVGPGNSYRGALSQPHSVCAKTKHGEGCPLTSPLVVWGSVVSSPSGRVRVEYGLYAYLRSERNHGTPFSVFLSDGGPHERRGARENSPFLPLDGPERGTENNSVAISIFPQRSCVLQCNILKALN